MKICLKDDVYEADFSITCNDDNDKVDLKKVIFECNVDVHIKHADLFMYFTNTDSLLIAKDIKDIYKWIDECIVSPPVDGTPYIGKIKFKDNNGFMLIFHFFKSGYKNNNNEIHIDIYSNVNDKCCDRCHFYLHDDNIKALNDFFKYTYDHIAFGVLN